MTSGAMERRTKPTRADGALAASGMRKVPRGKEAVDMSTFPLVRLDHLPLLSTAELQRALRELVPLIASLRSEQGSEKLLSYAGREIEAVRKQLGMREAAERVHRLLLGESITEVHERRATLDCGASVLSEPYTETAPPALPKSASEGRLEPKRPLSSPQDLKSTHIASVPRATSATSSQQQQQRRLIAPGADSSTNKLRHKSRRRTSTASNVVRNSLDENWGTVFTVSGNRKGSRSRRRAAERERIAAAAAAKVERRKRRERDERRAAKRAARVQLREREARRATWERERAARAAQALRQHEEARARQRARYEQLKQKRRESAQAARHYRSGPRAEAYDDDDEEEDEEVSRLQAALEEEREANEDDSAKVTAQHVAELIGSQDEEGKKVADERIQLIDKTLAALDKENGTTVEGPLLSSPRPTNWIAPCGSSSIVVDQDVERAKTSSGKDSSMNIEIDAEENRGAAVNNFELRSEASTADVHLSSCTRHVLIDNLGGCNHPDKDKNTSVVILPVPKVTGYEPDEPKGIVETQERTLHYSAADHLVTTPTPDLRCSIVAHDHHEGSALDQHDDTIRLLSQNLRSTVDPTDFAGEDRSQDKGLTVERPSALPASAESGGPQCAAPLPSSSVSGVDPNRVDLTQVKSSARQPWQERSENSGHSAQNIKTDLVPQYSSSGFEAAPVMQTTPPEAKHEEQRPQSFLGGEGESDCGSDDDDSSDIDSEPERKPPLHKKRIGRMDWSLRVPTSPNVTSNLSGELQLHEINSSTTAVISPSEAVWVAPRRSTEDGGNAQPGAAQVLLDTGSLPSAPSSMSLSANNSPPEPFSSKERTCVDLAARNVSLRGDETVHPNVEEKNDALVKGSESSAAARRWHGPDGMADERDELACATRQLGEQLQRVSEVFRTEGARSKQIRAENAQTILAASETVAEAEAAVLESAKTAMCSDLEIEDAAASEIMQSPRAACPPTLPESISTSFASPANANEDDETCRMGVKFDSDSKEPSIVTIPLREKSVVKSIVEKELGGDVTDYSLWYRSFEDVLSLSHDHTQHRSKVNYELALKSMLATYGACRRILSNYESMLPDDVRAQTNASERAEADEAAWRDTAAQRYYRVLARSRSEVYNLVTESAEGLDKRSERPGRLRSVTNDTTFEKLSPWKELPSGLGLKATWNLLWTWSKPKVKHNTLLVWQRVNHYPLAKALTRKDLLKKNLQRYRAFGGRMSSEFELQPATFVLPKEYLQFMEAFSREAEIWPRRNFWIMKPVGLSRGRGISLVSDISDVCYGESVIIQRYLHDPFLLDGHKFDLRIYVLVTSMHPLEAWIFDEGFVRLSTEKYSNSLDDIANKFIHLTNSSIQKLKPEGSGAAATAVSAQRHDAEDGEAGGTKLSLAYLWKRLKSLGVDVEKAKTDMKDVIVKSLVCCTDAIPEQINCFELFGYDILFDSSMRPWLVEVNLSPSMARENKLDDNIKSRLVRDTLRLVDPLPFDRAALLEVLQRRVAEMEENRLRPYHCTVPDRATQQATLNRDLSAILRGRTPRRPAKDTPRYTGGYTRICPGPLYERAMKLKRGAMKSASSL